MTIQSGLVVFHEDLAKLLVDIDSVQQHPDNYNNGDLDEIIQSIEINGMYRPIYVQRSTGYIFAGNHTWEACKTLGATQVPVVFADIDDNTALRIMLADNHIAQMARPDDAALLKILEHLDANDSLMGSSYGQSDLLAYRALAEIPTDYQEFAQWPTLCFQVPPHVRDAFGKMTEAAVGDRERFEMVLRLAGWDGKKR